MGKIYNFGGKLIQKMKKKSMGCTNMVSEICTMMNTYKVIQTTGKFISPRMYHSAALIFNLMYVFGGKFDNGTYTD